MSTKTPCPPRDLSSPYAGWINCSYRNATRLIQIVRVVETEDLFFEKVILPETRLAFRAPVEAVLEVHSPEEITGILADRIPCGQLSDPATDR